MTRTSSLLTGRDLSARVHAELATDVVLDELRRRDGRDESMTLTAECSRAGWGVFTPWPLLSCLNFHVGFVPALQREPADLQRKRTVVRPAAVQPGGMGSVLMIMVASPVAGMSTPAAKANPNTAAMSVR